MNKIDLTQRNAIGTGSVRGSFADPSKRHDTGLIIAGHAPWRGVFVMKFLWRKKDVSSAT